MRFIWLFETSHTSDDALCPLGIESGTQGPSNVIILLFEVVVGNLEKGS
jgi:hypothetical protein